MPDAPYDRQLFVCTYGAWCKLDGSDAVRAAIKAKVKEAGASDVRVTKSGCLGQCGNGPMAVLWPDNVWYHRLAAQDVDEIVRDHLVGGRPVERLRYRPLRAGSNKTDEVKAKEAEKGTHVE